ncbi:von Willebrand factor A domain-containing protein 7-like isoform X3 [Lingula anatina]|uniref:von Willebrand factor A domain-containing protein 7-like isoform X3 n=1 Tax=Lingula anatina TaxID=7574 RepID=A0A1S3HJ92_LINAN|nr:von Willebrand factor A domain-containing protein 7-like isoform X3 [Lingula anatina]|eukprot:XP_013386188.1 von Willebrand factor A domain-containing protein 7-like isoform X3 [Lingula anatina]
MKQIVQVNALQDISYPEDAAIHMRNERIKEGHKWIVKLRKRLLETLAEDKPNYDAARDWLGEIFHTLQDFYSNTNWIELNSEEEFYSNLGLEDRVLMPIAHSQTPVCTDCNDADGTCEDNLIDMGDVLTSGYYSMEDPAVKPEEDGKCSHGGASDLTRIMWPKGGINKETKDPKKSPHHYYHDKAATAANKHVEFFLDDPVTGLRTLIGDQKFKELFQIGSMVSMVFVIDDTGSMADEIDAVKDECIRVVETTSGTVRAPFNYILSTFNDPDGNPSIPKGELTITQDSEAMIDALQNLYAQDGGDCPELAMYGLAEAIKVSQPGSTIYFYTDAPAKDADREGEIEQRALDKNIKIETVLTRGCIARRRRSLQENSKRSRQKRALFAPPSLYTKLAEATGGTVYLTDDTHISSVVSIIQEATKTATVSVTRFISDDSSRNFTVDSQLSELSVKILGSSYTPSISVFLPDGTSHPMSGSDFNVTSLGPYAKVFTFKNPLPGIWSYQRLSSVESWQVDITGQSMLDFLYDFLEKDEVTDTLYAATGRPIAGVNTSILIRVTDVYDNNSLTTVKLQDENGNTASEIWPLRGGEQLRNYYFATEVLPSESFRLAIEGYDSRGYRFTRLSTAMVKTVGLKLQVHPIPALYTGETVYVNYTVTNTGPAGNFNVSILDTEHLVTGSAFSVFYLSEYENRTGSFTLYGGIDPNVTSTMTISVAPSGGGNLTAQYKIRRISVGERLEEVEDDAAPNCTILSSFGPCQLEQLDPCVCHAHLWHVTAEITETGFGLHRIYAGKLNSSSAAFSYDNFTSASSLTNPVMVNVSSDCCNPLVYINAGDLAGNLGQCTIDHRLHGVPSECIETTTTTEDTTTAYVAPTTGTAKNPEATTVTATTHTIAATQNTATPSVTNGESTLSFEVSTPVDVSVTIPSNETVRQGYSNSRYGEPNTNEPIIPTYGIALLVVGVIIVILGGTLLLYKKGIIFKSLNLQRRIAPCQDVDVIKADYVVDGKSSASVNENNGDSSASVNENNGDSSAPEANLNHVQKDVVIDDFIYV